MKKILLVACIVLFVSSCITTKEGINYQHAKGNEYRAQAPGCALVLGTTGSDLWGINQQKFKTVVGDQITESIWESLKADGYDVHLVILPYDRDKDLVLKTLQKALVDKKCNTFAQLSVDIGNENTSDAVPVMQVAISINYVEPAESQPKEGYSLIVRQSYMRNYNFRLDKQVMDSLIPTELGKKIASDLYKENALTSFKRNYLFKREQIKLPNISG